jgi:hypothetical protein
LAFCGEPQLLALFFGTAYLQNPKTNIAVKTALTKPISSSHPFPSLSILFPPVALFVQLSDYQFFSDTETVV